MSKKDYYSPTDKEKMSSHIILTWHPEKIRKFKINSVVHEHSDFAVKTALSRTLHFEFFHHFVYHLYRPNRNLHPPQKSTLKKTNPCDLQVTPLRNVTTMRRTNKSNAHRSGKTTSHRDSSGLIDWLIETPVRL